MIKQILLSSALFAASVTASADYTLPFNFAMDSQAQFNECTVVANEPAKGTKGTWVFDSSKSAFMCNYDSNVASDDWVIAPAVDFGRTNKIKLSIDACKQISNGQAKFEVKLGRSANPADMTVSVMDVSASELSSSFATKSSVIATEGGVWYVGIRCTSAAFSSELYVKNLSVESLGEDSGEPEIPEMPGQLYIVGEIDGYSYSPAYGQLLTKDGDTFTGKVNFTGVGGANTSYFIFAKNLAQTFEEFNVVGNCFTPDIDTRLAVDGNPGLFIQTTDFTNVPRFSTTTGEYDVIVDWPAMSVSLKTPQSPDTGIDGIEAGDILTRRYYNAAGIASATPFEGLNIVETVYTDGRRTVTKALLRK